MLMIVWDEPKRQTNLAKHGLDFADALLVDVHVGEKLLLPGAWVQPEVIEQITYLLFLRRLDDLQTLAERKASRTGGVIDNPVYLPGQRHLRWSELKNNEPAVMHRVMGEEVFPFLRSMGDGTTYSEHMKDARFTIPTPALLSKVVDMLDGIPMVDRDTNGDLYEYLLSKLASSGVNGQFRTPRHIIDLMVRMTAPTPADAAASASGTAISRKAWANGCQRTRPAAARMRGIFTSALYSEWLYAASQIQLSPKLPSSPVVTARVFWVVLFMRLRRPSVSSGVNCRDQIS